jgi:carboxylesterase type B
MAINPPGGLENEFGFIQKSLPVPKLTSSDIDMLNLNINVPLVESKLPTPESKLPVFVFVHGGGFGVGSNAWPQNDLAKIVKLSADMGLPVIGVGIK